MSRTSSSRLSVNIILIINESPCGSTLATTARRIARSILDAGHELQAVFFREDGVYNALAGTAGEPAADSPAPAWAELSERHGIDLMVCQSSAVQRLPGQPAAPFRIAGLVELMDRIASCDRVITL